MLVVLSKFPTLRGFDGQTKRVPLYGRLKEHVKETFLVGRDLMKGGLFSFGLVPLNEDHHDVSLAFVYPSRREKRFTYLDVCRRLLRKKAALASDSCLLLAQLLPQQLLLLSLGKLEEEERPLDL